VQKFAWSFNASFCSVVYKNIFAFFRLSAWLQLPPPALAFSDSRYTRESKFRLALQSTCENLFIFLAVPRAAAHTANIQAHDGSHVRALTGKTTTRLRACPNYMRAPENERDPGWAAEVSLRNWK
jgi:hypothetical protein